MASTTFSACDLIQSLTISETNTQMSEQKIHQNISSENTFVNVLKDKAVNMPPEFSLAMNDFFNGVIFKLNTSDLPYDTSHMEDITLMNNIYTKYLFI